MSSETKAHPFAIVPNKWIWFALSLTIMVAGVAKLGYNASTRHGAILAYGIDFTGGASYTYKFAKTPGGGDTARATAEVRQALVTVHDKVNAAKDAKIQLFADGGVQITTPTGTDPNAPLSAAAQNAKAEGEAILQALRAKFGNDVEQVASDLVGPIIGKHLRIMAFWALLWGHVLIMIYIAARYNVKGVGAGFLFGTCCVVALLHDVLVMVTVYAFTNTEVNTNFVAALLTVVGYSVNDTVIIFDRIRENMGKLDTAQRRNPVLVDEVIEISLWSVMTRSLVTVLATLLPLIMLFLFGGVTIRDFAFALLVGIISGCYSSIFNAPPLFSILYRWRLGRDGGRQGGTVITQRARPTVRERSETPVATPAESPAPSASRVRQRPQAETPSPSDAPASEAARKKTGGTASSAKRKRRH